MMQLPENLEITGVPPHVESWIVAKIPGFVIAVLKRWQRSHGELPHSFFAIMCPQVEINAVGGLPEEVYELTDPRLRCKHFTGCHRPYFVAFFTGQDADYRRAEVQRLLSWSESYEIVLSKQAIQLRFAGATEEAQIERTGTAPTRTLQELLQTGELVRILE
jgi:hypothetical protein